MPAGIPFPTGEAYNGSRNVYIHKQTNNKCLIFQTSLKRCEFSHYLNFWHSGRAADISGNQSANTKALAHFMHITKPARYAHFLLNNKGASVKMAEAVHEVLGNYLHVMPTIGAMFSADIGVAVTDREKYLLYKPGRQLDLKITAGTMLKQGTAIVRAMQENRRVMVRGDKTTFGLPYIATAVPVHDSAGSVIGGAVIIESVEQQDLLKEMAIKLSDSTSTLASTAEEISAQTEEVSALSRTMSLAAAQAQARLQETDQVVGLIKAIAGQTNMLGLNAAIEAAQIGRASCRERVSDPV